MKIPRTNLEMTPIGWVVLVLGIGNIALGTWDLVSGYGPGTWLASLILGPLMFVMLPIILKEQASNERKRRNL